MSSLMDKIPDHVRYPGMVVAILSISVISQIFLFRAAFSNGGPQIERDYYTRAVDWDKTKELRARRDALQWSVQGRPVAGALLVEIRDAQGQPLEGLNGQVIVQRADRSEPHAPVQLTSLTIPGMYRAETNVDQGVWNVQVNLEDTKRIVSKVAPWELRIEPAKR